MTGGWETWFTFLVFNCLTAESWELDSQEGTFLEEHFWNHRREEELQTGVRTQHCAEFQTRLCPKHRTEFHLSNFPPPNNRALIFKGSLGSVGTLIFETEGSGGIVKSLIQHLSNLDQWFSNSSSYQNHPESLINRLLVPDSPRFGSNRPGLELKTCISNKLRWCGCCWCQTTLWEPPLEQALCWNRHCVKFWEPIKLVSSVGSLASS